LEEIDMPEGLETLPVGNRYWRTSALGGLDCFRARFTTHRYARHWHDGYALGVVVLGAERYVCNRRSWHVAPMRTVIAINPGEVHDGASAAPDGWTYRMVYPSAAALDAVGTEVAGRTVRPALRLSAIDDPDLARQFVACHRCVESSTDLLEQESALLTWFASLLRRHADLLAVTPAALPAGDRRLERVRELIDTHPAMDFTLERLAAVAGIGAFHLVRSFKRAYGTTPHAWQIQCRLVRARDLIDRGEPLASAATSAGFCDQSHLTSRFRRAYGITPGEYRRASVGTLQ
jgi:AraC-like DNA-binding protein